MGEPTNDEWWRHDEPAVNDRQARERRAAERRRPEEDPYSGAASHPRASRDGRAVRPETGRSEAAELPHARRRSRGRRSGSSAVGHRGGPAERYGYSARDERGGGCDRGRGDNPGRRNR